MDDSKQKTRPGAENGPRRHLRSLALRAGGGTAARFHLERFAFWIGRCWRQDRDFGRTFPWIAVAFAVGVAGYFQLPREPSLVVLTATTLVLVAFAIVAGGNRPAASVILLVAATVMAGAVAACASARLADAPSIDRERTVTVQGRVVGVEPRETGIRLILQVHSMDRIGPRARLPRRVQLAVRGNTQDMKIGAIVRARARLRPPSGPVMPGGFDFARAAYFQTIGGVGFTFGAPTVLSGGADDDGPIDRVARWVGQARADLGNRIRGTIDPPYGAIAAALIVGERRAIPEDIQDDLRRSGLAHILAISGLHMALVAGTVFFVLRALLAGIPAVAHGRNVKKWAAAAALLFAALYLVLSGAGTATQRAFVMACVAFLAVIFDRPALTMRSVALAALIVMALSPIAVVSAGFQMSFAAVVALVGAYETLTRRRQARAGTYVPRGVAVSTFRKVALYAGGLAMTSLIAGLATMPIAAFHFHRVAPFGLIANLMAMPIVAFVIMPLAMLAMPFGLDPPILALMAAALSWLTAIAATVSEWTAGGGLVGQMSMIAPLCAIAGLLWFSLWQSPWRYFGMALLVVAVGLFGAAGHAPRPVVLVSADGRTVAARGDGQQLVFVGGRGQAFIRDQWLRADGDSRKSGDTSLIGQGSCDPLGCIQAIEPADGTVPATLAVVKNPLAFDEDCRRADIVVSALTAPADCRALVIDGSRLAAGGAVAVFPSPSDGGATFEIRESRSRFKRPWN